MGTLKMPIAEQEEISSHHVQFYLEIGAIKNTVKLDMTTCCCVKAALFSFHVIPYDTQNTTPHPPLNHPDGADPDTNELLP